MEKEKEKRTTQLSRVLPVNHAEARKLAVSIYSSEEEMKRHIPQPGSINEFHS